MTLPRLDRRFAGTLLVLGCAPLAMGQLYEGFDYPAATNLSTLNGGTGFPGAWGTNVSGSGTATVTAGSLDYAAALYPTETGNKVLVDGTSGSTGIGRALDADHSSGTFYFSYLTEKVLNTPRTLNVAFFGTTSGSERFAIGSHTTKDPGNFVLTYAGGSSLQIAAPSPIAYDVGVTHLIVGRVDFDVSGSLDQVTVYIDPVSLTDENSLTPYIQDLSQDLVNFVSFRMFAGGGGSGIATGYFDEFRFGDSFVAVTGAVAVPEPSSLAGFVGLFAAGLAFRRRRRA